MKKIFKPLVITSVTLFTVFSFWAFTQSDRYFEIAKNLEIFATLYKEVNISYVDEINPNTFMTKGIEAMLESLDPYTNYIPEDDIEDYRTQMTGLYGGIGSVIGQKEKKIVILMPYEGYPAHKSGMKIGDEIISIDGVNVAGKNTSDVSKMLRGEEGKQVKVTLKRYGVDKPIEVILTRERIKIENVPYYGMINSTTGYIKLTDFTDNASKEVKNALVELKEKGAKYIILDLRGNPGGLLKEAVNIANIFIPKDKPVVSTKGRVNDANRVYYALNPAVDTEIPIVVLVNGRSASASEIVAGTIQDYDRGVIIGQRSFGKGLVQTTKPLVYNSQLKVTTAKYYTPSGRCIQAIDYSKKNADGSAVIIHDSLHKAFKTTNGRQVFDGQGVDPDITVKHDTFPQILVSMINKSLIFDYATLYYYKHSTIPSAKEFKLTEEEYQDFVRWVSDKEYDYTTRVEKNLEELEKTAKDEQYYEQIQKQLNDLRTQIGHSKEKDLQTFKVQIKEMLEEEIASRYYLQKGTIEASFDNDKDILEALKLFNDMDRYKKILSGK